MRRIVWSSLLVLAAVSAHADPRLVAFPNGPRVLLEPDSLAGAVSVDVWYEGGFRTDPVPGMAYVLSQSTLPVPPARRAPLEAQGATFGAVVNADYVSISAHAPAELFQPVAEAQLERLKSHAISQDALQYGVSVARDAVRGRGATPILALYERLYASAFKGNPYAIPASGTLEGLGQVDLPRAQQQLERQFVPSKAWVTITGRFDTQDAMAVLRRRFGEPATAKPAGKPPAAAPLTAGGSRIVTSTPISVPVMMLGWRGPADRDPDSPAFEALAKFLAEGSGSVLSRAFMGEGSKILQVQGSFDRRRDASMFVVTVAAATPGDSAEVEQVVLQAVERWAREPLPADELLRAKRRLESTMLQQVQTSHGHSDALATAQLLSGDWAAWRKRVERVRALTAADVQRAAAATLTASRRTVLWARSERGEP